MSRTVDERIVELQFNNRQFESGAKESIKTIDQLTKKLNFEGVGKSINEVTTAVNKMDFNPVTTALGTVTNGFSALQIAGITAMQRITNMAIDTGKQMVSSLTTKPIMDGMSEYEQKLESVQTIMANTRKEGATMDYVTAVIQDMNYYADKTVYSFAEMTRNLGTFTAAGISLNDSAIAIKGFSNLSATLGVDATKSAHAMYQLSQALASGVVRLQDWMSMEQSGMAGQVFQDMIKETARESGIAIDEMIAKAGSLRNTLKDNWLTSDIMIKTLAKMSPDGLEALAKSGVKVTDTMRETAKAMEDNATLVKSFPQLMSVLGEAAQSSWSESWELIIGNFEEARELWTAVNNTIGAMITESGNMRVEMLREWKDMGGRALGIEAIKVAFQGLMAIMNPIKEAFNEIFPRSSGASLLKFTEYVYMLATRFKYAATELVGLKETFRGIFAILDIAKMGFVAITKGMYTIYDAMRGAGSGFVEFTGMLGNAIYALRNFIKENDIFNTQLVWVAQGIARFLTSMGQLSKAFLDLVKIGASKIGINIDFNSIKGVATAFISITDGLGTGLQYMGYYVEQVSKKISDLDVNVNKSSALNFMSKMYDNIKTVGGSLITLVGAIFKSIKDALDVPSLQEATQMILTGGFGALLLGLGNMFGKIGKVFDKVSTIPESISKVVTSVSKVLDSVAGTFQAFQNKIRAEAIMEIAKAIGILAASLVVLSIIDQTKLGIALASIGALFATLVGSMKIMSGFSGSIKEIAGIIAPVLGLSAATLMLASAAAKLAKVDIEGLLAGVGSVVILVMSLVKAIKMADGIGDGVNEAAGSMVKLAIGLNLLVIPVEILGKTDWQTLVAGIGSILVMLSGMAKIASSSSINANIAQLGSALIPISVSMGVLSLAIRSFESIEWETIIKGMVSMLGFMGGFAAFTQLVKSDQEFVKMGVSLIIVATSMKTLAKALEKMSEIDTASLITGMLAMGSSLLILSQTLNAMPKDLLVISAGLLVTSAAIGTLSLSIQALGAMGIGTALTGLVALGGAIAILVTAANLMNGTLAGSAAMAVMAVSLNLLIVPIAALGALPFEVIMTGLVAIAGALATFAIAGLAISPIAPVLLALGAAMALVSTSFLGAATAVAILGPALVGLSAGILAISATAEAFVNGFSTVLQGILEAINNAIPLVFDILGSFLVNVLQCFIEWYPSLASVIAQAIVVVLETLAATIPQVALALLDMVITLIDSVAVGIAENSDRIIAAVENVILAVLQVIKDTLVGFFDLGKDIITSIANGFNFKSSMLENQARAAGQRTASAYWAGFNGVIAGAGDIAKKSESANYDDSFDLNAHNSLEGKGNKKSTREQVDSAAKEAINKILEDNAKTLTGSQNGGNFSYGAIGNYGTGGLSSGVGGGGSKGSSKSKQKSKEELLKEDFNKFKKDLETEKYFERLTLEEEMKAWDEAKEKYIENADIMLEIDKKRFSLKKELVQEDYNNSAEWISKQLDFDKLTTEQQIEAWERVSERFQDEAEYKYKIDKQLYDLRKKLREEEYSAYVNDINHKKTMDQISLKDELDMYKELQAMQDENSTHLVELEEKVYTLQKEYNAKELELTNKKAEAEKKFAEDRIALEKEYADQVKSINEQLASDIQAINDDYDSQLKSRIESIRDSYGLFDTPEAFGEFDGGQLTTNLESQLNNIREWADEFDKLSGKGLDESLLEKIKSMGPSATGQIKALNSMTETELNKYNELWVEKTALATQLATDELSKLKEENAIKIEELKQEADLKLSEYNTMWINNMQELRASHSAEMAALDEEWNTTLGSILNSTKATENEMAKDALDSGKRVLTNMAKGMSSNKNKLTNTAEDIADDTTDAINSNEYEYPEIGYNIIQGLIQGLDDGSPELYDKADEIALETAERMKNTLDIHSPSRVFKWIAKMCMAGMALGFSDNSSMATDGATGVGNAIVTAMRNAMNDVQHMVDGELTPVITPVVDLSGAISDLSTLDRISSFIPLSGISGSFETQPANIVNNYSFTQTNNSPKALSANTIYRQTKNQLSQLRNIRGGR